MKKALFAIAFALLAACGAQDPVGTSEAELHPRVCPYLLIQCETGTHSKMLPNCRQVCVPDGQNWECVEDADCPVYDCFRCPCPVSSCEQHQCRTYTPPESSCTTNTL